MAAADTSTICRFDSVQLYSSGGIGGATFTWSPTTGLNNPNDPNPIASPDSSVVYTLVIAEGGCTDTLQIPISVLPTPVPDYINSTSDGCMPHTVSFVNSTSDGIFYVWNFNDGTDVVNTQNPTHTFTSPGNYPVTLTAYAPGGCSASIQASTIHVADTAFAEFASNPDFPVVMNLPNTTVDFINLSQNGSQWWWDFGDGQQAIDFAPTHQFRDPGEYMVTLTVVTPEGCQGSVIHGPYVVMTPDLFIPNVFTPNDDGINDRWLVQYTGSQPVNLAVYDRWGGLVYESKNKMEGWNGLTMQGDRAPEGVYYYYVRTGDREFTGEVTLMR
jgi:gliding motility-associated-like protein